jgi:hypothetical protein
MSLITCMQHRGDSPPGSGWSRMMWVERTKHSCLLLVKIGNKSHYLIF